VAESTFIRVSVDADLWRRFKIMCLQQDRKPSDYLRELIEREVVEHGTSN